MRNRLRGFAIVTLILVTAFGFIFFRCWQISLVLDKEKSDDAELIVKIGDTLFVFNETGVVYNNSFYCYDDVFVKYSMAVEEAEMYRDLCDRMSKTIDEMIIAYDIPVVWD